MFCSTASTSCGETGTTWSSGVPGRLTRPPRTPAPTWCSRHLETMNTSTWAVWPKHWSIPMTRKDTWNHLMWVYLLHVYTVELLLHGYCISVIVNHLSVSHLVKPLFLSLLLLLCVMTIQIQWRIQNFPDGGGGGGGLGANLKGGGKNLLFGQFFFPKNCMKMK